MLFSLTTQIECVENAYLCTIILSVSFLRTIKKRAKKNVVNCHVIQDFMKEVAWARTEQDV